MRISRRLFRKKEPDGKKPVESHILHRLWRKGRSVPGIIVEPAPWELDSGAPVNETASASRAMPRRDVAVVGAGPVGLAAALALAHVGADVVLIGPVPPKLDAGPQDTRTAALLTSSFDLLKAPMARGYFLGDYMGLASAEQRVFPVFGIVDGERRPARKLDRNGQIVAIEWAL